MISHRHKYIFIHIPKTAGASMLNILRSMPPYSDPPRVPVIKNDKTLEVHRHKIARELVQMERVTAEQFNEYFKFTFIRNPWSRAVSIYNFLGFNTKMPFNKYVKTLYRKDLWDKGIWLEKKDRNSFQFTRPQYDYLYDHDGHCLADYVGRFENLQQDFEHLSKHMNLPTTTLPHKNKSYGQHPEFRIIPPVKLIRYIRGRWILPKYKDYRNYYDSETIEIIGNRYKIDVETFGYSFDNT